MRTTARAAKPSSPPTYHGASRRACALALIAALAGCPGSCRGKKAVVHARDAAILAGVTAQAAPPSITIRWADGMPNVTKIDVYRRAPGQPDWGAPIAAGLAPKTTSWTDTTVALATAYEYRVVRTHDGSPFESNTTLYAGVELPLEDDRGTIVLIVDDTQPRGLEGALARLADDLAGDGWSVVRRNVARTARVTDVRAEIKRVYDADPTRVRAVLLIGHVPVPYSGNATFDGHKFPEHGPIHLGAWPADLYYGEMNAEWTDTTADTTKNPHQPARRENANLPGDGKFDQSSVSTAGETTGRGPAANAPALPNGEIELAVGRVDLADLPAFAPATEAELLLQYFEKEHAFRHKQWTAEPRGLVDDHFDLPLTDDHQFADHSLSRLAAGPWRAFAAFFGPDHVSAGPLFDPKRTAPWLWAFGSGQGGYDQCADIGTTRDFAARDPRIVFYDLQGSYFGDWDNTDNILRAPLATRDYGLAALWGRPPWRLDRLALGGTLGEAARLTQNAYGYIHLALMGDPTLRMHPVAPPKDARATVKGQDVTVGWSAPAEPARGYHVYRADAANGRFTRLTREPITILEFTDAARPPGQYRYMVRAVKLEVTASGSYFNASQGVFASATVQ